MSNLLVVHCKKANYDVYIGRPYKWGNPFVIGQDGTREEVLKKYEDWLHTRTDLMLSLSELRGKVLGCWCAPKACHGDILAKLANQPVEAEGEEPHKYTVSHRNRCCEICGKHKKDHAEAEVERKESE